ncbi:hypothetical protein QI003_23970 [Bacillus stercoris]|uniref:hypothetical protein n=1 Tax=Bacillus TaxID=1386 RepID=UPI00249BBB24|nr:MULTISPECIES: hypothetical protein [Bacillus]MDN0191574.1 hypothetical protein [Bacillus sp. B.PNR1]MDN3032480.1 hypothetical protein [Bacillus sp. B.PNR2]WGV95499.1 hypothetical protein QI003_23970 [Bacillus stercoris]
MNHRQAVNQVQVSNISVISIDTSSGIFIGTNYAHNWSSHRKNNYGLGSMTNSQVSHNFSYVIDNDEVDTPIHHENRISFEGNSGENQNDIDVGEMNINVLDTCAAISVGENELTGWSSHSKRTSGQGRLLGTIQNTQNSSFVIDNDENDCQINDYF